MQTGRFTRTETLTEQTAYGPSEYRLTKEFIIEEKTFNDKTGVYQTERTWRNSVMTYTGSYPANTDYAKKRREWVCDF